MLTTHDASDALLSWRAPKRRPQPNVETLKADAFVSVRYVPRDDYTLAHVENLARDLKLDPTSDAVIRCLSGVLIATRRAAKKGGLIAFSANCNDYAGEMVGYRQARPILEHLKATRFLTQVSAPAKGFATIYLADLEDDRSLRFAARSPGKVIVKLPKPERSKKRPKDDPKAVPMSRQKALRTFGEHFLREEDRLRRLNDALSAHPVETTEGDTLYVMNRIFNDGRMDCGGRLYGDWQNMKEVERLKLKIDGAAVCEIDLKGSYLFIAAAVAGCPILRNDPYAEIAYVARDHSKRKVAKRLTVAIISQGKRFRRFPEAFYDDFPILKGQKLKDYQEPIFEAYPFLENLPISGLEVMYLEAEIIMRTMEALLEAGIPSFPVHDCLICRESDHRVAVEELQRQMVDALGCSAAMSISFHDGREDVVKPWVPLEEAA
jgi:hypothetical protein